MPLLGGCRAAKTLLSAMMDWSRKYTHLNLSLQSFMVLDQRASSRKTARLLSVVLEVRPAIAETRPPVTAGVFAASSLRRLPHHDIILAIVISRDDLS